LLPFPRTLSAHNRRQDWGRRKSVATRRSDAQHENRRTNRRAPHFGSRGTRKARQAAADFADYSDTCDPGLGAAPALRRGWGL